jgi:hypothetical protein
MQEDNVKKRVIVKSKVQKPCRMLVIELSEAEKYFLDKFVAAGKLPTFEKLLREGKQCETHIDGWDPMQEYAWKHISPRRVWPSVYTGQPIAEQGIVGYGQKTTILQGQCLWDKLNKQEISTGVFGSVMSYPVRRNAYSLFYIPEVLAESSECFPRSYQSIQEFFMYVAHHYSDNSLLASIKIFWKLMKGIIRGIPLTTVYKILTQASRELTEGIHLQRNRVLLNVQLQMNIFQLLYNRYKPDFATIHLNHIAYMQHRYWRAAEPEHYKDTMGELDSYYFGDIETRKSHEFDFKDAILDSFVLTDKFLANLIENLESNTLLAIITALGQQKMDPADEIHKPEFQFYNLEQLFSQADIEKCEILTQMNPSITLNFTNTLEASLAAYKLSNLKILGEFPLFEVKHLEHQLFLEGNLPPNIWFLDDQAWIENTSNDDILLLFDYVKVSRSKDQSTAQYRDKGWMLFYGNLDSLALPSKSLDVTEIFSLLLSYF